MNQAWANPALWMLVALVVWPSLLLAGAWVRREHYRRLIAHHELSGAEGEGGSKVQNPSLLDRRAKQKSARAG